jgi:hypothetical protein
LIEIDEIHMVECIWLREVEKRPDADALLGKALAGDGEGRQ